ncbi:MAG TPA: ABC transporter substrate-binding protein, partial [Candidatus Saccharimonadales bacterium]|nr:ABC transporter substrate-binding protein [Candidatus Saccharimonadales bacterium]
MDRKRAFKLRFRRRLRMQRQQVGEFSSSAEQRLENDFFKRLERLGSVKRFVTSWMALVVLLVGCVVTQMLGLSGYYQQLVPAPGGTYTEGILGSFTSANPMYATGLVDTSVSRLLFAGLLTYDSNNQLTGDLANDWSVDAAGTTYTVHLRPHLTWQDGQPLTSADVLFTYRVIQNPDAGSPLQNAWQGIQVAAPNPATVTFTLPNPLASFPYSLTTGIVPQHILGGVPMGEMRTSSFNTTNPVGAGPFQWQAIQLTGASAETREENIALKPFAAYHAGKPKLNSFAVRSFRDQKQL